MAIRIRVATTAKELDDVYRLRHQVYVREKGRFDVAMGDNPRVVDHFDTLPGVVNVIAYSEDTQPIGTIRINQDSEIGVPAEHFCDYSSVRQEISEEYQRQNLGRREVLPKISCCGMLAIHKDWRNRRSLIFSLFKTAIGVMHSWESTHVICTISSETLSMYGRLGFVPVGESQWREDVRDHLTPLAAPMEPVYDWAFSGISKKIDTFWLDNFSARFERVLLSPGEILFNQDEHAEYTYAVDSGWVAISREDPEGNEMVLANLSRGALFGELAIFDGEKRSAKATALGNAELIAISREDMFEALKRNPEHMLQLLKHLAKRVRETDNLAMVQAFAPQTSRVVFALNQLWQSASPDRKKPGWRSVKIGPAQLARTARVREDEVRQVLEMKKSEGSLDYGTNIIRFVQDPEEVVPSKATAESPL